MVSTNNAAAWSFKNNILIHFLISIPGNFQTSKMKLFVIFAAFICLANATEEAKESTVAKQALEALKAIQGPLFDETKAEFEAKTDKQKTSIAKAFAEKFQLDEQNDKDELENLIKNNPALIKDLTDAKAMDAQALTTAMNSNANLETALELIAKSKTDTNSASAIGMSGLLVFSLFMLH